MALGKSDEFKKIREDDRKAWANLEKERPKPQPASVGGRVSPKPDDVEAQRSKPKEKSPPLPATVWTGPRSSSPAAPPTRPLNVPGIPGGEGEPINTALVDGVWQTDSSAHVASGQLPSLDPLAPTQTIPALNGKRTLRCLYLFAGIEREASIAKHLVEMCKKDGHGLQFWSVDVLIGGKGHDLLNRDSQNDFLRMIEEGRFDIQVLSPPCGSWSRANWSTNKGPALVEIDTTLGGFPTCPSTSASDARRETSSSTSR